MALVEALADTRELKLRGMRGGCDTRWSLSVEDEQLWKNLQILFCFVDSNQHSVAKSSSARFFFLFSSCSYHHTLLSKIGEWAPMSCHRKRPTYSSNRSSSVIKLRQEPSLVQITQMFKDRRVPCRRFLRGWTRNRNCRGR